MSTFGSDNWAGASDKVMAMLAEANVGPAPAYGNDTWTARAKDALNAFFEREVTAFFVPNGTGANALALAAYARPGGVILCHQDGHIARDEAGAPLQLAPQLLDPVDGPAGRIDPDLLGQRLEAYPPGAIQDGRPTIVSLTNATELGQCYTPAQVAAITEVAKSRDLAVHMDGARFFNALANLRVSAADMTWRAGVDAVSLGLTKTGAWCAEVVVLFDSALALDTAYRHKQASMLFSKNRFVAAQVAALLEDDHALALAEHANQMAARLADRLAACGAPAAYPPQCNEVFAWLAQDAAARLRSAGVSFATWGVVRSAFGPKRPESMPDAALSRFVTSYRTTEAEIEAVAVALGANA